MNAAAKTAGFFLASVVGLTVVGLGGIAAASADDAPNKNPHNGQVVNLFPADGKNFDPTAVTKRCDGTTLVYLTPYEWASHGGAGGGIAVVPDSLECK